MNIAVIRRKYDPNGGGAEKYAAYVVDELIARGHTVTVFAEKFANVPDSVTVVKVRRPIYPSLCRTASFAKSARRIVDHSLFDVVFALSRYEGADVYRQAEQLHAVWLPIYYSKWARFNPRHAGILSLEKRVFDPRSTGNVVTNSNLVRNQIVKGFGFATDRVNVIRNGVDRETFYPVKNSSDKIELRSELGIKRDALALLFVAGNFAIKGLDKAIMAIAGLDQDCRSNIQLIVVGGDEPQKFQELADANGVGSNILFAGKQSAVGDYYRASDMLFYPSLYEPFANVCLEACACGIPVLTTAQNGSSELVDHGRNGYVVENADMVALMTQYIGDYNKLIESEKQAMSQKALTATEGYSWSAHVDALELLFKDVKEKKNR